MRRIFAFILAIVMTFSLSTVAFAAETEDVMLQELEEQLESCAYATITDSSGNVEEVLAVEVDIQKHGNARSVDGVEYVITYTARAYNNHSANGSKDGVTATATITSNDVVGVNNILVSVSGGWSGDGVRDAENATSNRTVSYKGIAYNGTTSNSGSASNVGTSFYIAPHDFIGFTFTLTTTAKITATGHTLTLFATTDS